MASGPIELEYCTSNGADIAYADVEPAIDTDKVLLLLIDFSTEACFDIPWMRFWVGLNRFGRLVMPDLRGCGASDPMDVNDPLSPEERVDDLVAVLDAVGAARAIIVGGHDGAAQALLFASRHPARVESLILHGAHAVGMTIEDLGGSIDDFQDQWGHGWFGARIAPARAGDETFRREMARIERMTASPSGYAAMRTSTARIDVRPGLGQIRVPTLVLERREFGVVPESAGRAVAAGIPGATYVELAPDLDLTITDDLRIEIEAFLTGTRPPTEAERRLLSVLLTDVVDSSSTAQRLGDRRWREVLERHEQLCSRIVDRFGGSCVKWTGDGLLATFDSPSRAVRCAAQISEEVAALGIAIRAGVHAGELEVRGADVGGIAVHVTSRVCAEAGPGAVVVSQTIQDVVAGSGLLFEERGDHELRGIAGRWRLFDLVRS
jgi:class 3 adenylate cyclase/pimeloyl-ACP methyl ester carboxylesterase